MRYQNSAGADSVGRCLIAKRREVLATTDFASHSASFDQGTMPDRRTRRMVKLPADEMAFICADRFLLKDESMAGEWAIYFRFVERGDDLVAGLSFKSCGSMNAANLTRLRNATDCSRRRTRSSWMGQRGPVPQ